MGTGPIFSEQEKMGPVPFFCRSVHKLTLSSFLQKSTKKGPVPFFSSLPSGPDIRNVRKFEVNLSGISLRTGIRIKF